MGEWLKAVKMYWSRNERAGQFAGWWPFWVDEQGWMRSSAANVFRTLPGKEEPYYQYTYPFDTVEEAIADAKLRVPDAEVIGVEEPVDTGELPF